ncbi:Vacuolar protein sorting-associated protein vps5 [Coemansia sp. RSA 1822]|nr:Vacuolar protein sorting-associated protein vps5 [Coemansia sp. RSA 638]KAJ2545007.1 Vacuolar protein sorting-associated protein vps5 [Coemansia sp. RSA 1853]KAJ2566709.1 Vacuolar protein sorting-associated protein vps5 [Coemansia sp. RSA 1822]
MDDDMFGGGFGTTRQQPFSFDEQDMNPFSEGASPWTDANTQSESAAASPSLNPAITVNDSNTSSSDTSVSGAEEPSDAGSDDVSRLHQDVAAKLRVSADPNTLAVQDEADDDTQLGKLAELKAAPHSARRVGVIKRGLRSPRVLGKQLSATAFEDPLTSAAAGSDFAEAIGGRASIDVTAQRQQKPMQPSRQTRSLSESRPGGVQAAQLQSQPFEQQHSYEQLNSQPHPYEQQLSPPLQHEQVASAREHVDGVRRASVDRPTSASTARTPPASRAYLGSHQRRRSLDVTPADQIPEMVIEVTDPVKVSDALKSYVAYKVHTRSAAPMFRERDMTVRRRYRDFDWLVQELVARHPGVIVPAIPEKQSMGRFGDEFVEARRAGLESCLARIGRHVVLWNDDVFRLFLEADDFATKARLITEARVAAEINGTAPGSTSAGLFGGARYKEKDEWFARRMQELDAIEEELRALLRALDYSQRQRRELAISHGELGEAYLKMAGQELNAGLAGSLTAMGSLQQKLKVLQGRQGSSDVASFQLTTDEYIRMIGGVRLAFAARGRAHTQWQGSLSELLRRRKILEGYTQHPGRASAERLAQLKGEIARAEIRTETSRNAFDDVSLLLKHEIVRFDAARVRDFQATIETYLASLIGTQEEIVVLWEAYLASLRTDPVH